MQVSARDRTGDLPAILGSTVANDPAGALLTYYDDATGERSELSAVALGEWAARTANLLVDGCGLGPGDRAAVLLPPHWQTAAVLLGAWSAGVSVNFHSLATAGLPRIGPDANEPIDVTFVTPARLDDWLEDVPEADHRFVLGLAPSAAPLGDVPAGYRDYLTEVREHGTDFRSPAPIYRTDAASGDGTSYREWGTVAHGIAATLDLRPGDRLLIDAAQTEHPVKWLLAPLAAGASVVLCANLDPAAMAARAAAERVTRVL
jgi:uncharacterized protein (TIGR03089 family)